MKREIPGSKAGGVSSSMDCCCPRCANEGNIYMRGTGEALGWNGQGGSRMEGPVSSRILGRGATHGSKNLGRYWLEVSRELKILNVGQDFR
jgi:hypothetical protein